MLPSRLYVFLFLALQPRVFATCIDVYAASGMPLHRMIDKAEKGDTLRIHSGVYSEGPIAITKSIALIGETAATTIIDGADTCEIFLVHADGVVISGLTIRNSGNSYIHERAGIRLERVKSCIIENNVITNVSYGVYSGKCQSNIIRNNTIHSNALSESSSGNGIHCWYCQDYLIENNRVEQHRDGIYLEFTTGTKVIGNESHGNMRYGLHFMFSHHNGYYRNHFHHNGSGVAVMYTNNIEMIDNVFEDNRGDASYGLLLKDISHGLISNNVFRGNTAGIFAESGGSLDIRHNHFESNGWAMRLMASSTDNTIDSNNFIANSFDVATNNYASYSSFAGNYWDKYSGYDLDKNGIGDVPYRPVRFFSTIVEQNSPAMLLLHSFFVSLLDIAESIFPTVTPATMQDLAPSMKQLALNS